ncbi:hypothetical protein [Chitinophaga ginsengisoli]|uniref:Uncharacterized protein n=1 Tax=Chitinophaga ginsengisoli TaxID=363837 RepID=A0A2P8FPQ6_9BACT|nr:hypothetical protein [Chitinophaga ginsengisoli]PSL23712.1 hypothetical protein CLV42_11768 [Chitinophaga ginsengisoli]
MYINHKRIRNVDKYLIGLNEDDNFYVASADPKISKQKAINIGFSNSLNDGEAVLPRIVGSVSKFNAEGGFIKLMNEPKETCYKERLWTWKDWGGTEHTKIVYVPYQRYKRQIIDPPGEELVLVNNADVAVILSNKLKYTQANSGLIKHIINLFLELFGDCQILKENLTPAIKAPIHRLNWNVLPPGKYPWEKAKAIVNDYTKGLSQNKTEIIKNRINVISRHEPDFIAIGEAGFHGYWVLGFTNKKLYILESLHFGNATYVLGNNWETISQMTKAEIISGSLSKARIIHREGWATDINNLFK